MQSKSSSRDTSVLRIAIQKSGRLSEKSIALFAKCGLEFEFSKDRLLQRCKDFPVELMLVRDDDIPEYVADGVCDLGIVGENVIRESLGARSAAARVQGASDVVQVVRRLGFGHCRLSLAVPAARPYDGPHSLEGLRIATSYPECVRSFLEANQVTAQTIVLAGSVEIAPSLEIADVVCDLVSSGSTLRSNGLREVETLFESQAVMIRSPRDLDGVCANNLIRLTQRMDGVMKAQESKYIMMNAPRTALPRICQIIPGMEEPSVMPLGTDGTRIAIHAVARENVFWETIEALKEVGASSILVLPIEKVIS